MTSPFTFHGHELVALPGRGLYWPAESALLVADAHFGKSAAFRASGVAVPETARPDLERLEALLGETGAKELILLGDFLHQKAGRTPAVLDELAAWRSRRTFLQITLIRGNHDLHAEDPPAGLGFGIVNGPIERSSLLLTHDPSELGEHPGIAGHIHPAFRLDDFGGQSLRLPCFFIGKTTLILPAFGSFTGMHTLHSAKGERVIVIAGERTMPLTR